MAHSLTADTIGPVDVAVLLFEGNDFNGEVAPALADLHNAGTVHLIDLAFVRKDADGTTAFLEVEDADVAEAYARIHADELDLLSDNDLTQIAESLDPGSSALVVVFENTWVAGLARAIRESRGQLLSLERVPRESVLKALTALEEG
jgi:Family of unknown function (DUF6325)